MRYLVALSVLLGSCRTEAPDEIYRKAVYALRNAGNAAEALRLAREGEQRCLRGLSACRVRGRLLEAEILLDNQERERAAAILAEPIPETKDYIALRARQTLLEGALQLIFNGPAQAEQLFQTAVQLASASRATDVLLDIGNWRARALFEARRVDDADAAFRREVTLARASGDAYNEARALNGLGMMRLKQERFDEAIPWFEQDIDAARRGNVPRMIEGAAINLGICYSHLGDFDEALRSLKRAMELLGQSGLVTYRMNILGEMGAAYRQQGDARHAIPLYQQALEMAVTAADKARIHRQLADSFVELRDWDTAERHIREAASLDSDASSRAALNVISGAIASGRGSYDQASSLFLSAIHESAARPEILWESHARLANVYVSTHDYQQAAQEFAKTIRIINDNFTALSKDEQRLTFLSALIHFYQDYVNALVEQHDYEGALEVADSSRARILIGRIAPRRQHLDAFRPDYRKIAAASGGTLLFYWLAPERSFLWVVGRDGISSPFELPPADRIQSWVDQYRAFIERRPGDPIASENAAGRQLYEALIKPAARLIPRNSKVIIVPDGPLHWLNFETLPVYGQAGEKPHYWIEDVTTAVAPSLSVLTANVLPPAPASRSLLIIGDPVSPSAEFPRLPYAAGEIQMIRHNFPAGETFTGTRASPAIYRDSKPQNYSLLHFTTHAVANQQSPLDSAIILSRADENFKLYARDIMDVPLNADLVTISACRSAGARSYTGEGLVGFAWAFLQAGAHQVIAGLWDVTDSSTRDIMDEFYAQMAGGKTAADSLRQSKLALIHSSGAYRKPYYWGPFQIYMR